MDERIVKFRVGVMVVATLLVVGILVALFGKLPSLLYGHYTVFVWFPQTPGVADGTPVRKDGILIGRVTDVKLLDAGGVVIRMRIDGRYKVRRSEVCRLSTSLLGDAILEFVAGTTSSNEFVRNGDYLEGNVGSNPLQAFGGIEGDLNQAIGSVANAGREIGRLAVYLNEFTVNNDEQLNRIVNKTELAIDKADLTLDDFQKFARDFNSVLGDEQTRANLKQAINEMPALLKDTREAVAGIQSTVALADSNLKNLEGLTKPLGDHGEEMINNIDASMARLNEVLTQFVEFGKSLNSREGTLGRILNDPELYEHVEAAACNIEQLTKELKPIIRNVNTFTDKIARHPGVLVRDAVKPNSGIK
jgi:phospholipid/cholesterol/gamma-HCH transport system substrate-binding protein